MVLCMKQTLLTICLILFALPVWGYCKGDNLSNKPNPEEMFGVYFFCGPDISYCDEINDNKHKKIFKSLYDKSHYDIEYDYMLVLPDDLTSPDNEERIMIYGEIGFSSKTISRHGSFQNTFNFKEFICSKANALKCRFDGKMTSEFIKKTIIEIQTDGDCGSYGALIPDGFWKKVNK